MQLSGDARKDTDPDRIETKIDPDERGNLPEAFADSFPTKMGQIEMHIILSADPSAGPDFLKNTPGDHVSRSQIFYHRGVSLHKAFALGVKKNGPFPACGFTDEDPERVNTGG